MDDQRTNRESGESNRAAVPVAIGIVFAIFGLLPIGMVLGGGVAAALRGVAMSRNMAFATVLIIGFSSCWVLMAIAFAKAYSNLQPGVKWWRQPTSNDREVLEHYFTPKGLFWMQVFKYSVIAGFAVFLLVGVAERWTR